MVEPRRHEAELLELEAALSGHGLSAVHTAAFVAHFRLLLRWNPTHNLTRILSPREAAVLHYLDSVFPLLAAPPPPSLCDVGSGAGFPGLVAAVLWPSTEVVLVEPARKRASFLQIAASELGLKNVRVTGPSRVSTHARVLSRATFSAGARHELWAYVAPGGSLWAWTTHHDRSTWEREAATWLPSSTEWVPYRLPSPAEGVELAHGLLRLHRASD